MSQLFDLSPLGGTAPCPALHHLGWPWLGVPPPSMTLLVGARCILTVQLTTIEVGPGLETSSFFLPSPLLFFCSLAAPPAGIQSDSDPK